jgi:ABC-type glycerol-3-phosphate transport system substrate-binding protein
VYTDAGLLFYRTVLEWIYSYGGGTIVEPDKRVTINNPNAIKVLDTARGWIGTISPAGVTIYGEEETRNVWQAGLCSNVLEPATVDRLTSRLQSEAQSLNFQVRLPPAGNRLSSPTSSAHRPGRTR